MTRNPILTVLSTLNQRRVKYLLIGGQACIIYGAAEFSRDSDFVLLGNAENLHRLEDGLNDLEAKLIYVPPLELKYLKKGHACHFRCHREDVEGLRIDVMSKLRGCDTFSEMWERRYKLIFDERNTINIIGLKDLVQSKKTQRDKDWLMLKRLVNNDILLRNYDAAKEDIRWWFQECMDADVLIELSKKHPDIARESIANRPLLNSAVRSDIKKLHRGLLKEEELERDEDRKYWAPLRKELETLRRNL